MLDTDYRQHKQCEPTNKCLFFLFPFWSLDKIKMKFSNGIHAMQFSINAVYIFAL